MPQRRTAIKALRQNRTKHMQNLDIKSDLKKTVKNFLSAAKEKKTETADLLKVLYKKMDKAANRKVMHKRTAARRKSHFARIIAAAK